MANTKPQLARRKQKWLRYFLDETNPETFLHRTNSTKAAGYNCKSDKSFAAVGTNNLKRYKKEIGKWLDEEGLSENALKTKLISLLSITKKEFFAHQGIVIDEREIPDTANQIKALRLATEIKDMKAPQKHEITGPDGQPLQVAQATITPDMSDKEAAAVYANLVKGNK